MPEPEEIYNLKIDPWEQNNLIYDNKSIDRIEYMRELLYRMMRDTDSPILHSHVEPNPKQVAVSKLYLSLKD